MSKQWSLYIGCLPTSASENSISKILSEYGGIVSILLQTKKGKCIGSGKVEVSDSRTYETLLKSTIMYKDRKLEVSPYLEQSNLKKMQLEINLRKVVVRGLFAATSSEELHQAFLQYGAIENAYMSSDKKEDLKGKPKNYGFVIFHEKLGAFKAMMGLTEVKGALANVRLQRPKDTKD